jgi:hypothetical protein
MHDPCTFNFDTPESPSSFGMSILYIYMTCFFGMIFYHQINHQYVIAGAHVIMMCMIVCTLQSMYTEYSDGALCAKTQFQGFGFDMLKPIRDILLDVDKILHYASFEYITDCSLFSWIKNFETMYNLTFIYQLFYNLQMHKIIQQIYAQKFTQKHKAKESLYNLIYMLVIANLLWAIPCFIASIQWLQNVVSNILKFNFIVMIIKCTIYPKIEEYWWKQLEWLPKPANSSSNHTAGLLTGEKAVQAFLMNHKHTEFVYINAHYNKTPPTTFIKQETWLKGARMNSLVTTLGAHCMYKDGTLINLDNFRRFIQEKHKIYTETTLSSFNPVSAFAKDVLMKLKIQNKPL